jgi:hypothetical protein
MLRKKTRETKSGGGKRATLCEENRKLMNILASDSEGPGSVTG